MIPIALTGSFVMPRRIARNSTAMFALAPNTVANPNAVPTAADEPLASGEALMASSDILENESNLVTEHGQVYLSKISCCNASGDIEGE